ncbi:Nramp family divalent metal transporter [Alteromonas oceanisediminis]|uniref:Nramp family divalent metal transporter n=1 Tax=Alteromonas oceanisediminis TaxID=2836180 RepID=UPI001BDB26FC|nr:Nramp family divalent metal transporter [Alteromonas oceanisediminis]MBT0585266.1 Nramp family divalent metal transporter [Alteromonas oceanisediminis]
MAQKGTNKHAGWLIAAAFIGPGTVTTASIAGAEFGYSVLWALLFSIVATLVLQDMTVRLGVVTRSGLAEALKNSVKAPAVRWGFSLLIVGAIGIGNAAYEGGNLTGAALGLSQLTGVGMPVWVVTLSMISALLLWFGGYKLIEKTLLLLVAIMSFIFIATAIVASPDWNVLLSNALSPRFDAATFTIVLALIGTTIVPYNLFLHASVVSQYSGDMHAELNAQRRSSAIAITCGGFITLAILTTATGAFYATGTTLSASNIAAQLQPLLGDGAADIFAVGLFAAGLTSAITAPLAAAYAVCGAFGLSTAIHTTPFRFVWLLVLLCGAIVASIGFKPLAAMLFAQATNGLLLPFVALFLIMVMNDKNRLGQHRNHMLMNVVGGAIVLFTLLLGLRKLIGVF